MTARPGAARLALRTGCPVIPVGQWGAQDVMPGKKLTWPRFIPRRTMHFRVGAAVELSDLYGRVDAISVTEAGARIMAAITELVSDLRGEPAPEQRFDPRQQGVRETGNPNDDARGPRRKRSR